MSPFFIYLIQVNIALALFYLLYAIVLKRDTFLRLRRFFFLSVIVFSLLYPFFAIPALNEVWSFRSSDFQEVSTTVFIGEPGMAVIMDEDVVVPASVPWKEILSLSYIAITFVFILRFVFQLLSIYSIRIKSNKQIILGIPVYQLKDTITPFSFFNLIFIHTEKHSDTELSRILLHEQTHARQWHSIDIMLIELVCLFSWWNPFVWLMKREMAMNLEYLADNGVLREGIDSREYQYHLLQLTYHETAVQIVNNFNVSQLKQRIMMMNKAKSPTLTLAKYLLIVPLFFLFVTANSIYAAQNEDKRAAVHDFPEPPPEKVVDEVFVVVEEQPEFPGGTEAMMKYLADNIRYPVEAQKNGIQGRVICNYVVMKDGSINDVNIVRGVDPLLDAEAVRVIQAMPKWKPGKQRGQAVNVRYTLPVVFRLQGDTPQNEVLTKEDKEELSKSEKAEKGVAVDEVVVVAYSAEGRSVQDVIDQDKKRSAAGDEIFVVVENPPRFPGGNEAMMQFLGENIRYPKEAAEKRIQGRVICNFVVMKDGSIDDVNVVRGVDPLLDEEAVRVLQSMPKWEPGKQRGQAVNVRFTLPVVFSLDRSEPTEEQREDFQKKMENFEKAEFPGGEKAFMKYLADNVRYPVIAQENGIQGHISVVFNIDSKGKVTFVRFEKGVDPSLDAEVKRVIEKMPDWTPAKMNGEVTSMTTGTHFVFRLQGDGVQSYSGPVPEDAVVVVGYGGKKASE